MLKTTGFAHVEEVDLTSEFSHTTRGWYEGRERYAAELIAAEGDGPFQERQRDSAAQLKAIEGGLVRRSLFAARRP
jgi:hypothetical protein